MAPKRGDQFSRAVADLAEGKGPWKASAESPICGKRTARFLCTLDAGHVGAHGRRYRRNTVK